MGVLAWASVSSTVTLITRVASGDSWPPFVRQGHPSALVDSNKPICWETQGPHERDCVHVEPLTAPVYPLTLEMLERASSRYTTTDLGLHRAFHRARKRGMLKVLVVGGSVTYGHGCQSPSGLTEMECAWPNRLQQWCEERIEDFTVEVRYVANTGPKVDVRVMSDITPPSNPKL